MRFDHAGIATRDATTLAEQYSELLDAPIAHEESLDGMEFVFLSVGEGYFELIEPLEDDSPIAEYLQEDGTGIHHLAVTTDDAAAAIAHARDIGIEPIDEEPRKGAWGHDIAFLNPEDTGGVLLEFVEH
jgi:methylmalonyl-CoA/ethylmalonyl-CoA epimerase